MGERFDDLLLVRTNASLSRKANAVSDLDQKIEAATGLASEVVEAPGCENDDRSFERIQLE